jgi:hypothetical protein
MKISYMQAVLTIHCHKHGKEVEFYADDDALGPLDSTQLLCPGLSDEVKKLHERSNAIDLMARKQLALRWAAEHPDEVRLLPSGYMKTDGWTFEQYPLGLQRTLQSLDQQEERLADECLASWTVELTSAEEVNDEHASTGDEPG